MIYITVKLSCKGFFTWVSLQVLALAGQPEMEEINGQLKKIHSFNIYIYNSEDFDTQGIHNSFDQTQLFTLKQRPRFSFQLNKEKKLQGANYGILEYTDTTDTNLRKGQANPPGNQLLSSPNQKGSPWWLAQAWVPTKAQEAAGSEHNVPRLALPFSNTTLILSTGLYRNYRLGSCQFVQLPIFSLSFSLPQFDSRGFTFSGNGTLIISASKIVSHFQPGRNLRLV